MTRSAMAATSTRASPRGRTRTSSLRSSSARTNAPMPSHAIPPPNNFQNDLNERLVGSPWRLVKEPSRSPPPPDADVQGGTAFASQFHLRPSAKLVLFEGSAAAPPDH